MCALLAPAVSVTGVSAVEQLPVLIPGPSTGLVGITLAKATTDQGFAGYLKDNDDVSAPVELSVPRDGMRRLATVGDIVLSQRPVAGTQIPSGNAVNVIPPPPGDPGDSGDSGDSSQPGDSSLQEGPSQPGDSSQQEGPSQPEPSSPPGDDGIGTSDGVDGETPRQPETSSQPEEESGGGIDGVIRVPVPDLGGLSEERAEQALNAEDLVLGEVSGEGDEVVSQSPVAGTMVSPGSAVNVDMGAEEPVYVVVPNLVGSTVQEAKQLLYPDLVLNEVSDDSDEAPSKCDVIDSQYPVAGEEVPPSSTVDVYLKSASVPVPNVVSRTVDEARVLLTAAGLVLDNDLAGASRVESQEPAAETLVCPGSVVTVIVSEVPVPPAPPVAPLPPPVGEPPVGQPPAAQPPLAQPPVGQPPVGQPPAAQPPLAQPPAVLPEVPPTESPVAPVALIPRWWPIPATLTLLIVAGILVSRALRALREQKGINADIRIIAGADLGTDVEVMQSPSNHSQSTCVVRIEPHADSGTQVLEEVHQ
ncbi:MAG: PASTA domain-containing protein [Pseudonocardiaceae bacterium]